jgi:hypothetical protein
MLLLPFSRKRSAAAHSVHASDTSFFRVSSYEGNKVWYDRCNFSRSSIPTDAAAGPLASPRPHASLKYLRRDYGKMKRELVLDLGGTIFALGKREQQVAVYFVEPDTREKTVEYPVPAISAIRDWVA